MTTAASPHMTGPSPVLRGMLIGQHALFVVLLLIGTVRAVAQGPAPVAVTAGAAAVAAWYAAGHWLARRGPGRRAGAAWLAVLVAGWLGLVTLSAEFSWLAFSLFFLCVHLLAVRAAVPAVAALTTVVIAAQLLTGAGPAAPKVVGPLLGATVAVAMGLAYRRLVAENEQRRRLVEQLVAAQDDLVATHDELAAVQRQAGALAERARLARDIHDTLAQGFSSIVLLSRAGLAGADAGEVLRQVHETAARNLDEARRVVHALTPSDLADAPLPAAVGRLVERFARQTGVAGSMTVDGEAVPLPTAAEVALLRIAQGALANVRQHAHAARVAVSLSYAGDQVSLDVVDDGRGFDPAHAGPDRAGGGFGLRAMRERLAALGGSLVIESAPGEGAAVAAVIPLTPSRGGG